MSAFVVMIPVVMAGPAFAAAAAVAGAALGLKLLDVAENIDCTQETNQETVNLDIPNSHGLSEAVDEGDFMTLQGNGFSVRFSKTGRGDCKMSVTGEKKSKTELKKLGTDLINKIAQQYAYQKVTKELKQRGFSMVKENVEEEGTIRLTVRKWS